VTESCFSSSVTVKEGTDFVCWPLLKRRVAGVRGGLLQQPLN